MPNSTTTARPVQAGTNNVHLDTALLALDLGLSPVLPAEDGSKRPEGAWKRFQTIPATREEIIRQYRNGRTGNGLATGYGNVECLEWEDAGLYDRFKEAAIKFGLSELVTRVESGYCESSPGGGIHWLYRCDKVEGNTKLAERLAPTEKDPNGRETLIETRGLGGFIVTAPSNGKVHPSGGAYKLISGGLAAIATIAADEREALFWLARSFDEVPVEPTAGPKSAVGRPRSKPGPSRDGISVGDDFNARANLADIIEPFDWKKVHTSGGVEYWRRPGKTEGWSATWGKTRGFRVFTSSTSLPAESLSLFAVYCYLRHKGDWKACVKDLVEQGYGTWIDADGREHQNPPPKDARVKLGASKSKTGSTGGAAPSTDGDPRPEILITTDEADVNDDAIDALKADPSVYQRNFRLVTIAKDSKPKNGVDIRRAEGTPVIRPIQSPRLREMLARAIRWRKLNRAGKEIPAHPPEWTVSAILAREEWPDIRYLLGVTEIPTLRADGSVIETPGYDERTGLLYAPCEKFSAVPSNPTKADAEAAATELLALVADFPLKDGHKAAWLAGLLTPMARHLIDGPVPLFLFEANTSGAGKTLLADIIALILTGRPMTRTGYSHDPVEMDKQIVSTCLAGDRVVLFDNLDNGGRFGNSALDRALTGRTYRGRVLGKSEMTPDLDLCCVFYASGNNLSLCGDIQRRVIPCRLESPMEKPEERSGFRIPDLAGYASQHRGRLVIAGLTILHAYILAGKPDRGLTPYGSFSAWSGLVRNAVHWAVGIDPAVGRKDLDESNPDRQHESAFVHGWHEVQQRFHPGGMTSAELLQTLNGNPKDFAEFRGTLAEMWPRTKPGELPSSGSIGMKIQAIRGKSYGGMHFQCVTEVKRAKVWKVVPSTTGGESDDSNESISHTPREKHKGSEEIQETDMCGVNFPVSSVSLDKDGKRTHQAHQTHREGAPPPNRSRNGSRWVVTAEGPPKSNGVYVDGVGVCERDSNPF